MMIALLLAAWLWLNGPCPKPKPVFALTARQHTLRTKRSNAYKNKKKPKWVTDKVLYLKAISGHGCGKVAETFNRLYGDREIVSKSFVYDKVRHNRYQLQLLKKDIRNKPPRVVPVNQTWGMDLTTVTLGKKQRTVLGIIDHGSRLNLKLAALETKHAWQILAAIAASVRRFGVPKVIRTDNESCFCSLACRLAFRLLGIKHQKTDIASPWQNGRIERFFGTFKPLFRKACFAANNDLQAKLDVYTVWYNQLRTHENLGGLTPQEARAGGRARWRREAILATGWDGVLTGYYFPD